MKKKLALVQLLRRREPALLVSGQTVSNFGDGVALVALIATHSLHYWELIVFAVLFGCFDALFYPCLLYTSRCV